MPIPTDIKYLDQRTAERYIERGELSRQDWEEHLRNLPDLSDKAAIVEEKQPGAPEED